MVQRGIHRLTDKQARNAKIGFHADGGGLWLRVKPTVDGGVSRNWVFRYERHGREHNVGLGPLHTIGLADARDAAVDARRLLLQGEDPLEHKRNRRAASRAAVPVVTFRRAAQQFIDSHEKGWSPTHSRAWRDTLAALAYPVLGNVPVQAIDTPLVLRALHPHWESKTETANRIRGRIEAVLNACKARGEVKGDNPAAWAVLKHLLPAPSRINGKKHLAALPFEQLPAFMAKLRAIEGPAARALEFAILCASRSGEVRFATWDEIDLDKSVWTIPGSRMKSGREHVVPLCRRAVEILREAQDAPQRTRVFHSPRTFGVCGSAARVARSFPGIENHGARLPVNVPRLVRCADELSAGGRRNGSRPSCRRRD
jgi:integrase